MLGKLPVSGCLLLLVSVLRMLRGSKARWDARGRELQISWLNKNQPIGLIELQVATPSV